MEDSLNNKESGFEDWSPLDFGGDRLCYDENHNPPMHLVVPEGKRYRHVCPTCKQIKYLYPKIIYSYA